MSYDERAWSKVAKAGAADCWPWLGAKRKGYGRISWGGANRLAHRIIYELARGPIPEGLTIDHLCRNRACCNPEHMETVSARENMRRAALGLHNARKTHCPAGHPYSGDNLFISGGGRFCRTCRNAQQRAYQARRKLK